MRKELGKVEISEKQVVPETKTDMAGEPPKSRVGISSGFSGNDGSVPPVFREAFNQGEFPDRRADQTDADIFWAIHEQCKKEIEDPTSEPLLSGCIDQLVQECELTPNPSCEAPEKKLRQFLKRVKDAGLIKLPRKLTLRQYIGLLVYH